MKGRIIKVLTVSLIVLVSIQFIQIKHNLNASVTTTDFMESYHPPLAVSSILRNACYDCHSNNTRYPWYSNIQPLGWLLEYHVENGKTKLNFNEFATYPARRQHAKLRSMINQIKDNRMPLASYKLVHGNARLNDETKQELIAYLDSLDTRL